MLAVVFRRRQALFVTVMASSGPICYPRCRLLWHHANSSLSIIRNIKDEFKIPKIDKKKFVAVNWKGYLVRHNYVSLN